MNIILKRDAVSGTVFLRAGVATVFAAVLLAGTAPVFAGFEWRAPAQVPAPSFSRGDGSIQWDKEGPAVSSQKVQSVESAPIGVADKTTAEVAVAAPADIVSGFGTDLPLVTALRQVVPEKYMVSFAPGVNPGVLVSWVGEKPWQKILTDMLSPQGLGFRLQDNVVQVGKFSSEALPASAEEHVVSPSKADMIPEDILPDNRKSAAGLAAETAEKTEPVTIRREKPTSLVDRLFKPSQKTEALPPVKEVEVGSPVDLTAKTQASVEISPAAVPVKESQDTAKNTGTPVSPVWRVTKGQTLKEVLTDWSKAAHVDLQWTINYDYRLNEDIAYSGRFEEAVGELFGRFTQIRPQPYGSLHRGAGDAQILVVNSYDTLR